MKRSNYKGKSNSRRPSSKGQFKRDDEREVKTAREKANDPDWYTASGQLVKDVASLSFNNPSGIKYWLDTGSTGTFVNPGVMSIYMAPVAGYSEDGSSPINVAAKNIYSWVRHANSGHSNYDSPDLMLYILAMANAYSFYGWMTRLYGMCRVYTQTNRYMGSNLVTANGVDAGDIIGNLANFRAYINQFAIKLSALSVPTTMSLFKRYMWMFSNLFTDENDTKAQIYMYQPAYFYRYDETSGAGKLVPVPLCLDSAGTTVVQAMSLGNIRAYGDALLSAMISSEDINIMSGDILKAYGADNVWRVNLIPEDYAIAPVFSEEVLEQIHNTVFMGSAPLKDTTDTSAANAGWDSFIIYQDTTIGDGALICKPISRKGGSSMARKVLDFWKQDVTPEDIIVASRNMIVGRRWSQGFTSFEAFGTEIPVFAAIWQFSLGGVLQPNYYYYDDTIANYNATYTTGAAANQYLSKLSYFNEHPYFYLGNYTTSSPYFEINAGASIGEVSNFTIVDEADLEKMHLTAILSELAVPLLGNIVRG